MVMNHKQLKLKIFLIFSIPAIALIYFSSTFVISEYKQLRSASALKLSTEVIAVLSDFIHNIQIERGLSAGYIITDSKITYKTKLINQYKKSDISKKRLIELIQRSSKNKTLLTDIIGSKVKPHIKEVIQELHIIKSTRNRVLNSDISFEEEILYYSKINESLISSIKVFTSLFHDFKDDANAIVNLQELKENIGLQRAYIYHLLLSNNFEPTSVNKIRKLVLKQSEQKENFFLNSSLKISTIFNINADIEVENSLDKLRDDFFNAKLDSSNATAWFNTSSKQIDIFNSVVVKILKHYNTEVDKKYQDSLLSLYITALFWIVSIIALIVLIIVLKKLMANEEKFIAELDTTKNMYQALSKINDAMIHIDKISDLYQYFTKILYENSNSKIIWIGLVDDENTYLKHEAYEAEIVKKEFSLNFKIDKSNFSSLSLASKSIIEKSILFSNHEEFKNTPEYKNDSLFNSVNSVAAFPINNENKIIGSVMIFSDEENTFDGEYISLIEKLINELSFALSKLSTQEKRKKDLEELRIASYAFEAQEAMTITDIDGVIIKVNQAFTDITGYSALEVIGKNPNVLQSSKHSKEFYEDMWESLLNNGKWHGEIYNRRKNGDIYPEILSITAIKNEEHITTHYIAQFLDITVIKEAQEEAEHQADHDFLTGLINRKSLMERLNEEFVKAKRHDFLHAFLFIDLDNFKNINDYYGHNIGDMLIVDVAKRLKQITREEDVVSRISGDEFAVMILNIDKKESEAARDVKEICTKILTAISEPFLLQNNKIEISSSIGVKLFPDGEKSINDVIIHADTAMYQAKNQGKNQFVFFDHTIELEMKQIIKLEKEIKSAFKNSEFEFFYQSKVDVSSQKIVGAELLARWKHPTKGLLYPDSFIETANDMGMIHNFTKLALESAAEFLSKNSEIFDGSLAINISSHELLHQNFEKETLNFLKKNSVNPEQIEFEITETDIINDYEKIIQKILNLQKVGIKFSIDDFGTGYSSLTYLQKLPVNTLKIDKEFFLNLHLESNKELVRLMSNMAKTFHMDIVAEGIENDTQLDFIKEMGTQLCQGFYFSRAVQEEQFTKMLQEQKESL